MHRTAVILGLAVLLAACASPTPYAPATGTGTGFEGGYSQQRIEEGRWRVSFAGNSVTRRDTVESYLLYRAAELTLEQGGDHFVVVERSLDADTTYVADYEPLTPYYHPFHDRHPFSYGPPYAVSRIEKIERYSASAEVVIGKGPKPEGKLRAYDASDVIESLRPNVRRPGDTRG